MTPLEALRAATLVNARLLRMEGRLGVLKPGAFGDLVAVPGNPLEDVTVAGRPTFVMAGGRVVLAR
jgi:imidazolonepropionase-like amidohydrolase